MILSVEKWLVLAVLHGDATTAVSDFAGRLIMLTRREHKFSW